MTKTEETPAMFEAVLTLCLIAEPEICRDTLVPGHAAEEQGVCRATLHEISRNAPPGLVVQGEPTCQPVGRALELIEVAPDLFVHEGRIETPDSENGGDVSNLGVVIGETSVAVIDTGNARWIGEALWRAVRQRTDLPVSHVVLTHMHPDHVFGTSVFTDAGAQVVGHARLARALADRRQDYRDSLDAEIGTALAVGSDIPTVDLGVADTLTIDLGGRALTVQAWPTAHTPTDLTVLDEATGTLFAGDLVFNRHAPSLDGSLPGWLEVLDELDALEPARVVPGHGDASLPWPEGGAALKRYLEVLARDTRAAIDAGERLGDAVQSIAASEAESWELFEVYNPANATVAFTELEWE